MPTLTLCHGCDAELEPGAYCASCGEVTETYEWDADLIPVYATRPSRIDALLAKSAQHDLDCVAALTELPGLLSAVAAAIRGPRFGRLAA